MSTLPTKAASEAGKRRAKRKLDMLEEVSPVLQLEAIEQTQPCDKMDTGKSKRIKLSARGLLATLSTRKISVTNIKLIESFSQRGGTFADVMMATLVRKTRSEQGERRLAVKKLRFILNSDMTEEKFLRLFANELQLLERLSHPNIVQIIGFVEDLKRHIAWLVFPWEDNGNLREFLRSGKWEAPERVSLIKDVSHGLEYLHTRRPPVCHGDLKSLNILVNSSRRAVITDFGSARIIRGVQELGATSPMPTVSVNIAPPECSELPEFKLAASSTALTLTGPAWSFRWAPPEVLTGAPPDLASDVWALGWIAWEAITDCYPFEGVASEFHVTMKVIEGHLPPIGEHNQLSQIHRLCGIMQNCWKSNPRERPSATDCRKSIRWIPTAIPIVKRDEQFPMLSATLLLRIGENHRLQRRVDEASTAFKQGLTIARSTGDQTTLAALLIRLAREYCKEFKHAEAEMSCMEALAISESIGNEGYRAPALLGLARIRKQQSEYIQAEAFLIEALAIHKRKQNSLRGGKALLVLADVQRLQYKDMEAEATLAQALAVYESIGDYLGRANALHRLASIHRKRCDYIKAEAFDTESAAICNRIGVIRSRLAALRQLGDTQRLQSKYVEAEVSFTEALAIPRSITGDKERAKTLYHLGDIQRMQAKYIEAKASFTEAVAIFKGVGDDKRLSKAMRGLEEVQRLLTKDFEAEASCAEAPPSPTTSR